MIENKIKKGIKISKLDAAKRQIETAIRLYFSNDDPVSIHTLTAAAYNIIRDINKKQGNQPMLVKDKIFQAVKPEYEKLLRNKINKAENFFKHASADSNQTLDFNPEQTDFLIIDACSQYYKLTGEDPVLFKTFRSWFMANYRDLFNLPEEQATLISSTAPDIIEMGRSMFFKLILPIMMKTNS